MEAMHNTSVVHLNRYPSNFMWRRRPGSQEMDVRIIDFDQSHFIADRLSVDTIHRLSPIWRTLAAWEEGGGGRHSKLRPLADAPAADSRGHAGAAAGSEAILDLRFKRLQK